MKVSNNDELNDVFSEIGYKYGYRKVEASFNTFPEFKVKYTRTYNEAVYEVSDYLVGADELVIANLADVMMGRFRGCTVEYSQDLCDYLTSKEFADKNLILFLDRNKSCRDPFTEFNDVKVYWSTKNMHTVSNLSSLMKVIILNKDLRSAPKDILDTIIKMEYNHIQTKRCDFKQDTNPVEVSAEDMKAMYKYIRVMNFEMIKSMF